MHFTKFPRNIENLQARQILAPNTLGIGASLHSPTSVKDLPIPTNKSTLLGSPIIAASVWRGGKRKEEEEKRKKEDEVAMLRQKICQDREEWQTRQEELAKRKAERKAEEELVKQAKQRAEEEKLAKQAKRDFRQQAKREADKKAKAKQESLQALKAEQAKQREKGEALARQAKQKAEEDRLARQAKQEAKEEEKEKDLARQVRVQVKQTELARQKARENEIVKAFDEAIKQTNALLRQCSSSQFSDPACDRVKAMLAAYETQKKDRNIDAVLDKHVQFRKRSNRLTLDATTISIESQLEQVHRALEIALENVRIKDQFARQDAKEDEIAKAFDKAIGQTSALLQQPYYRKQSSDPAYGHVGKMLADYKTQKESGNVNAALNKYVQTPKKRNKLVFGSTATPIEGRLVQIHTDLQSALWSIRFKYETPSAGATVN